MSVRQTIGLLVIPLLVGVMFFNGVVMLVSPRGGSPYLVISRCEARCAKRTTPLRAGDDFRFGRMA